MASQAHRRRYRAVVAVRDEGRAPKAPPDDGADGPRGMTVLAPPPERRLDDFLTVTTSASPRTRPPSTPTIPSMSTLPARSAFAHNDRDIRPKPARARAFPPETGSDEP